MVIINPVIINEWKVETEVQKFVFVTLNILGSHHNEWFSGSVACVDMIWKKTLLDVNLKI